MIILKLFFHINALVKKIFYKLIYGKKLIIGKKTTFRKSFSLMIDSTGKIEIGKNCFFNNFCSITSNKLITIGDNSLFGENVKIYDQNHRFSDPNAPIKFQGYSVGEVHIGNNCWIGSNVVILKGANIGDHCVIGAGAIISGVIPDNTIVKPERELEFINMI